MSNSKFLYSAVSFQKTFRIDNPEEVQEKLETYFKALFEYKGKRLVNSFSHKCRVKDCQYEANTLRSYFCNLHSSVANLITYRMWGGLCSAENCISKSQFGENKCRFHLKYDKADLPAEITKEEIEDLALDIAVEFYLMILEDPTLVL
ncbi:hypothetical protein PVAND_003295 [Polypedilum vanderplanki]|uniref:Uncharacterized protein n=1 Tax=Polypedilum vanderplanki TaxID=319348 RepID=A0A9J6BTL5_POLVA|nr:hypothetical protein PVAND_003295 [Polypedilum vanderplanki]